MSSPSRGIRNHNPGNIDYHSGNRWKGQLGMEEGCACPRFARFDCAENGIRALAKLLLNYGGKDGLPNMGGPGIDTVLEIIQRKLKRHPGLCHSGGWQTWCRYHRSYRYSRACHAIQVGRCGNYSRKRK
jgi:hypothetical protein